jgi:hypothetical protein
MNNKEKPKFSETRKDLKIGWQLFKENYKSFIATEIFALLAFIIVNLLIFAAIAVIFAASPNLTIADLRPRTSQVGNITFFISVLFSILAYLTMSGFLYCQFGLAYDIISSGDMFTEFKQAFVYFRDHWWKYILLIFVTGFGFFVPDRRMGFDPPLPARDIFGSWSFLLVIIRFIILLVILILFSGALPSVTAQGSLRNSFVESFRIVKKDYKRLIKTWSIYFITFNGPAFTITLLIAIFLPYITGTFWMPILMILLLVSYLYKLFIGFPMLSLIATRIYNSVDFERFKPLTTTEEKIRKEEKEQ